MVDLGAPRGRALPDDLGQLCLGCLRGRDLDPLWHFDGTSWSSQALGDSEVHAIWGTGPTNVWAAGDYRKVAHFDGSRWRLQEHEAQRVDALAGSGPDDIWAWGHPGLFHFDGRRWQAGQAPPIRAGFRALGGRMGGPVALVGQSGGAAFWDGRRWQTLRPASLGVMASSGFWVDERGQTWLVSKRDQTLRHGRDGWTPDATLFEGVPFGDSVHGILVTRPAGALGLG